MSSKLISYINKLTNGEWIVSREDVPEPQEAICVKDKDGNEWLVLEGYPEWAEKRPLVEDKFDIPHKRMWWQLRSYLVKAEDHDKFFDWAKEQNFWGRWMPESRDRYEMFSRESYWSPAYKFFQQSYYSGELWQTIHDRETGDEISDVMVSTDSYMWEEEFDFSKDSTLNVLKPVQDIFENMTLGYSQKEGEYIDADGKVVCFDPSVYNNCKQFLLIRKVEFLKYLQDQNLRVIWTMIGEKQVIGGNARRGGEALYPLEMSACFKIEDDTIIGDISFKQDS